MFANKKYKARSPNIAKILEVNTIKGSSVIAKIAGMLSTAKISSLTSTKINTRKSGVTYKIHYEK